MDESDSTKQRAEPRRLKHFALRVQGTDICGEFFVEVVLTENVSSSGVCVKLNRRVSIGERLQVFINNGHIQSQAIGQTRWISSESSGSGRWRVGLKFDRPPKQWEH